MTRHRLACTLVAVAAALVAVPSASAAEPSWLFTMTSTGGSLTQDESGWWVTLTGTSPLVTRFSDRPQRIAATETPARFAAGWRRYGFAADPPNAALVIADGARSADVFVVELRRPRVRGTQVTFRARPVGTTSRGLSRYRPRADRMRELTFGTASLFIDDASATVYQQITLQVDGFTPGQPARIVVAPADGTPIGFSSGPPLGTQTGWQVIAPVFPLPVSQATVTSSQILISTQTPDDVSVVSFLFTLYLAAGEGIRTFTLQNLSNGAQGQVSAQIGDAPIQVVNPTPTPFAWG